MASSKEVSRGLKGLQVFIPTRGRVDQQITLRSLPPDVREKTVLVCPKEEQKPLMEKYKHLGMQVYSQPSRIKNIADKRAFILKDLAPSAGVHRAIMLDDDLYFFGRCPAQDRVWSGGMWKPKPGKKLFSREHANDEQLTKAFIRWNELLEQFAHAGMADRAGTHVVYEELIYNGRMMYAIGYDVDTFKKEVQAGAKRMRFREDFDYTLQLLRKGYENRVIVHHVTGAGGYHAKGGCSDERNVEESNKEAEKLAALHPGFVRVVDKDYKGTPRKEVVVSWKKALASAKEK